MQRFPILFSWQTPKNRLSKEVRIHHKNDGFILHQTNSTGKGRLTLFFLLIPINKRRKKIVSTFMINSHQIEDWPCIQLMQKMPKSSTDVEGSLITCGASTYNILYESVSFQVLVYVQLLHICKMLSHNYWILPWLVTIFMNCCIYLICTHHYDEQWVLIL